MEKMEIIRSQARRLRLSSLTAKVSDVLLKAQRNTPSYDDFLSEVLQTEIDGRDEKQVTIRMRLAKLPVNHNLDLYDQTISNGLSLVQLKQLRELHWLEESYNILLAGPSGVGKTFIASGLCYDAIRKGYRGIFRSMDSIISTIKRKDISPAARKEYKVMCEAQIIVIDDIMSVTVDRDEGNLLFAFINSVYETTSFIITTNKSPVEWARTLPDEVLGTALLDRKASRVLDRFHVQRLALDAVQEIRIKFRWDAIEADNKARAEAKANKEEYKPFVYKNGDTRKELLARSRYALYKSPEKWTESQKTRAKLVFNEYPDIERAYWLSQHLRAIFNKRSKKTVARLNLARWYKDVEEAGFESFQILAHTIFARCEEALNYFDALSTNANAESFNAKIKNFRASLRGVTDVKFFLFRLYKIYA